METWLCVTRDQLVRILVETKARHVRTTLFEIRKDIDVQHCKGLLRIEVANRLSNGIEGAICSWGFLLVKIIVKISCLHAPVPLSNPTDRLFKSDDGRSLPTKRNVCRKRWCELGPQRRVASLLGTHTYSITKLKEIEKQGDLYSKILDPNNDPRRLCGTNSPKSSTRF